MEWQKGKGKEGCRKENRTKVWRPVFLHLLIQQMCVFGIIQFKTLC